MTKHSNNTFGLHKKLHFCLFTTAAFAFSQYLFGELNSVPDGDDLTSSDESESTVIFSVTTHQEIQFLLQNLGSEWVRDLLNLYKHCCGGVAGLKS